MNMLIKFLERYINVSIHTTRFLNLIDKLRLHSANFFIKLYKPGINGVICDDAFFFHRCIR